MEDRTLGDPDLPDCLALSLCLLADDQKTDRGRASVGFESVDWRWLTCHISCGVGRGILCVQSYVTRMSFAEEKERNALSVIVSRHRSTFLQKRTLFLRRRDG